MTILIIHYHLRAGGVTRVIQTQAGVLRDMGHDVVIASSGPIDRWDFPTLVIPELDYRKTGTIPVDRLLDLRADLWIIHNPTLGLNSAYPDLVEAAVASGSRILLQIHDFVEDGRPENYQLLKNCQRLYPTAPHVHYATINRRDFQILRKAGVPLARCHYLPNAVNPPQIQPSSSTETLVFYPVRGIRRKNLGELCLLAAHAPEGTSFAIALRSSSEEPAFLHDDWVHFAREQNLPVRFDVTLDDPQVFDNWLKKASHLVTTSISEGFGLTFLDPALLGKPLIGRDLPEITCDFTPYGTLYQSIPVPVTALPGLAEAFRKNLQAAMSAYGKILTEGEIDDAWEEFGAGGEVDFGNLPEDFQRNLIKRVHFPWLKTWLTGALTKPAPQIDTTPWSLPAYSRNLAGIIPAIDPPGPVKWIPREKILAQFLDPRRFHFLRAPILETQPA